MSMGRRRVWVVWSVFLVLLAGMIAHEITNIFEPKSHSHTGRVHMFSFHEPDLSRIEIVYKGRLAMLRRDATGAWSHDHDQHRHDHRDHSHGKTSAEIAERIASTVHMFADRQVNPEQSLDQYGLMMPQAMITFYGHEDGKVDATQPLAVLYVGNLLPDQYTYYTMRDGDQQISLLPRYYIALLLAAVFGKDQVPTPLPVRESSN